MSALITPTLSDSDNAQRITEALRELGAPPKYLTHSGRPLARCVADAAPGSKINDEVRARAGRWSLTDDVEWGAMAMHEFRAMRAGELARAPSALATKVDLRKFGSAQDFRRALSDSSPGAVDAATLARSLTPAAVDEGGSLFIVSELTLMVPELIEVARMRPYARTVLPMKFLNAPGASWYQVNVIDEYGEAQMTSNFDGTPPVIGTTREKIIRPLQYMWMMARWGLKELMEWQQARANGMTLPDFARDRPRRAREALLRMENFWLFFGGPTGSKILGLLSLKPDNTSAQGIQITNSANWANLTAEANVKVITDAITRITDTGVEVPNLIMMGTAQYNYFATTQWPNTDKMLLGILIEALKPLGIEDIVAVPELQYRDALKDKLIAKKYDTATATRYAGGVNEKDAMVVLSRRPDKVAGVVSQDVRSLPPEVRPAETSVIQILASGGVEVGYPEAHQIVTYNAPT